MSILKSILHRWNKENKSYDTLHPETESAQITDWHSGIMASLASTTLGTVVSAVTTDSVLGKLIKLLLDASGVKYLIDTNGYVCFGSLFGGLIIQWGIIQQQANGSSIFFPIKFLQNAYIVDITDISDGDDNIIGCFSAGDITNTKFTIKCAPVNADSVSSLWALWFCIGQ